MTAFSHRIRGAALALSLAHTFFLIASLDAVLAVEFQSFPHQAVQIAG